MRRAHRRISILILVDHPRADLFIVSRAHPSWDLMTDHDGTLRETPTDTRGVSSIDHSTLSSLSRLATADAARSTSQTHVHSSHSIVFQARNNCPTRPVQLALTKAHASNSASNSRNSCRHLVVGLWRRLDDGWSGRKRRTRVGGLVGGQRTEAVGGRLGRSRI